MAARITVDTAALRSAGAEVDGMAGAIEQRRGALVGPLVSAQAHLSGSSCGAVLGGLADAVVDVHGDLVTALGGFAEGLEHVAATVVEVDVVSAAEARAMWRTGP